MIGSILKELRKSKGLTVAKAAELFGVASRTYTSYELEEREPNLTMLNKIADYYGVTTDYLLGREPAPDPLSFVTTKVDDDKFVELYSSLPEYAKSIFIDTMEKLAQAKKDQTQKKHRAYMETTLGAIEDDALAPEEDAGA